MRSAPRVEVVVFTYNHAAFVERALRSILEQRTEFPFSVRIHDDCSTDGTVGVIQDIFADSTVPWELIQPTSNRYAEGTDFYHEFIAASSAEYAAILDGDDFWVDPEKLQRQIELLERHPRAALCHHPVLELIGEELRPVDWPPPAARVETMPGSRLSQQNVVSSSSVVVRTAMFPKRMPGGYNVLGIGDYPMWALASAGNEIAYVDRAMTAYRVHDSNIYASLGRDTRFDRELEARIYISNFVPEDQRQLWREGIVAAVRSHTGVTESIELTARLEAITEELEKARTELDALRASTSWRITAPLRALSSAVRRRRGGRG